MTVVDHSCQKIYGDDNLWDFDATYYLDGDLSSTYNDPRPLFTDGRKWTEARYILNSSFVEDGYFETEDKVKIHYWYVEGKERAMPAIIVGHGHFACMGRFESANMMNLLYNQGFT